MIIKSYEIEKNPSRFLKNKMFLLYGENDGLKKDIKEEIKKCLQNKDVEILSFFESDIETNQENFYNSIYNGSLFGDKKIIVINNGTDKIINQIEFIQEKNPENIFLIVLSDILEKKSKLRTLFEKNDNTTCVACYLDNERDLERIVRQELQKEKINLSKEIINFLIEKSNNNRGSLKNEINKIKILFKNKKELNINEIKMIINFSGEIKTDNFINHCLCGNISEYKKMLSELYSDATNQIFLLRILSTKIQKLLKIKENENNYESIDILLNSTKPPIFWKEKPLVKKQLAIWSLKELKLSINKINSTELLCKKNPDIAKTISFNLFTEICRKANNYS